MRDGFTKGNSKSLMYNHSKAQTNQSNLRANTSFLLFILNVVKDWNATVVDQSKQYLIIFDNKTKARKVNIRLMSIFDIPSYIYSQTYILNVVKQCTSKRLSSCVRVCFCAIVVILLNCIAIAKSYRGYKINSYVVHVIEHKYLQ